MALLPLSLFAQATFTVNSEADTSDTASGNGICDTGDTITGGDAECTLRAAIQEANSTSEKDTINFDIPGGGVRTILPDSALPILTEPIIIDGSTQPGYSTTPVIEIDGTNAAGVEVTGLEVLGGNSTIRALAINSFSHTGLMLKNKSINLVEGSHIGTNAAGTVIKNNGYDGLAIIDSSLNIVGGTTALTRNVISGNSEFGIVIANALSTGNVIIGNFIGTDVTGLSQLPNSRAGVLVSATVGGTGYASDNIIGGTDPLEGNVISGNLQHGIEIYRSPRNRVLGNLIGVTKNGTSKLPNKLQGIQINDAADNKIGDDIDGAGNVISGNDFDGIGIGGELATGNTIKANFIGTDLDGSYAIPNGRIGVLLSTIGAGLPTSGTVVGSNIAGFGNVISGNKRDGVQIGFGSENNVVIGNKIGVWQAPSIVHT